MEAIGTRNMSEQRAAAALRVQGCSSEFTAHVTGISPTSIDLLLNQAPAAPAHLAVGRVARVDLATTSSLMRCDGVLARVDGARVSIKPTRPPNRIERREGERRPLRLAMVYRTERGSEAYGAWQNGWTVDISVGGMKIETRQPIPVGQTVEVQFMIPLTDDAFIAGHRIRVSGTVRHAKPAGEGWTSCGLRFTRVLPVDRLRILRLVEPATQESQPAGARRSGVF